MNNKLVEGENQQNKVIRFPIEKTNGPISDKEDYKIWLRKVDCYCLVISGFSIIDLSCDIELRMRFINNEDPEDVADEIASREGMVI